MMTRTRIVNSRGRRFLLLSSHSCRHSSERFFFMIIARRNGEINRMVSTPVMRLPYISRCSPGNTSWMKGRKKVNITAMVADVRMA